jgi:hypothetical protein
MVDVDTLIRDIAHGRLNPEGWHADLIREHVSAAPFNPQQVRAERAVRGLVYQGRVVQQTDDSVFIHLVKRVHLEKQWATGTTQGEYLEDLQRLGTDSTCDVIVYDLGPGPVAALLGRNTVPPRRLGTRHEPFLFVVYAPERRAIISGYQISGPQAVNLSKVPIWLT